jgi:lipoate---protein ligase
VGALSPSRGGPVGLTFAVHHERATAAVVADRPWPEPAARTVWFVDVDRPILVLGSTQPDAVVDRERAAAAGVEVVRRRSGGGAVLLRPGETVWADVLLPAGDPLAESDVGRAFGWIGRAWARALAAVGVDGAVVHEGRSRPATPWSAGVCFAGLGPGEVTVGGAKVVGISQRRTREGTLFQCGALLAWEPGPLVDLLVLPGLSDGDRADLAGVAAGIGVESARLATAFERALDDA